MADNGVTAMSIAAGCAAMVPGQSGMIRCSIPALYLYSYACACGRHAHVRWSCLIHRPVPGQVGCLACLAAGHECAMNFAPFGPGNDVSPHWCQGRCWCDEFHRDQATTLWLVPPPYSQAQPHG